MTDTIHRPFRRFGAAATAAAASLFIGAIVILWSWNTIAVDLFDAPNLAFRHAVALELAIAVIAASIGFVIRLASGARQTGATT